MQSKEEVLKEREISGLRLILVFRLLFLTSFIGGSLIMAQSLMERIVVPLIMSSGIAISILYWTLLKRKKYSKFIGYSGAVFDVIILLIMPILWHQSVGGDAVSRAFILKSPTPMMLSFVLLIIHSLANRPAYPLVITIGVLFNNIVYSIYSFWIPGIEISSDLVQHELGAKFAPGFFVSYILAFLLTGIIFSIFLSKNHKTILRAVQMERHNDQIARFFSPRIYEQLSQGDDALFDVGGKRQQVAILFADIRGFTAMSDSMKPEEIMAMLSDYHTRMVEVIFRHGGTLDKFIGDGIMATFGTPHPGPNDILNSVKSGIEMKRSLKDLNQLREKSGLTALRQGIGIHYGEAIVGNIGSRNRLEYTVIGDSVNVASRVESACKVVNKDFLITQEVYDAVKKDVPGTDAGLVSVKGKPQPLRLYSVEYERLI